MILYGHNPVGKNVFYGYPFDSQPNRAWPSHSNWQKWIKWPYLVRLILKKPFLAFCRKNGLEMQNYKLGKTHR